MSRGRFAGLSLQYIHSAKFTISPLSSSANKLRHALPYFTTRKVGEVTALATPPPPKGPSSAINIHVAVTAPGKPAEEGGEVPNTDSLEVVYTDGTVLKTILGEAKHGVQLLQKVEKHARALRLQAEAKAS